MQILYWLESVRNPFLDTVFSFITHLGEETLFIVAGLLFFWCISKKQGYYLLAVGFLGTVINQCLKLLFRIPRPWVKDPGFSIVESARAEATGYSFPSGHTETAVGVFGGVARLFRSTAVRVLCIAVSLLVALSRLYLGVHTPLDVGVSLAVGTGLVLGLYPVMEWAAQKPRNMRVFFAGITAVAAAFLLFTLVYPFPADTEVHNLESGVKNACKIFGCVLALWLAYEVDTRWIRFETTAVWWAQLLKLVLGLLPLLAIKSGLKAPLNALFQGSHAADAVRYFLLTAFAGCVWPLTFRWFARLGKSKEK